MRTPAQQRIDAMINTLEGLYTPQENKRRFGNERRTALALQQEPGPEMQLSDEDLKVRAHFTTFTCHPMYLIKGWQRTTVTPGT